MERQQLQLNEISVTWGGGSLWREAIFNNFWFQRAAYDLAAENFCFGHPVNYYLLDLS